MMQMLVNSAMMQREAEQAENQEAQLLEQAIQDSLKENPNPDMMNYEQLQELGD